MIIVLQNFTRNDDKMNKNMEFGMLKFLDAAQPIWHVYNLSGMHTPYLVIFQTKKFLICALD